MKLKDYRNKLIKTRAKVLFENKINREKDKYFGRWYNAVIVKSNEDLIAKLKIYKLLNVTEYLFGEMIIDFNKKVCGLKYA